VNRAIDIAAPFVSNDSAYKHVSLKLGSDAHAPGRSRRSLRLRSGPGFTGFNTPATFLE